MARCARADACGATSLFAGDDCVTICEGFTIAYGECNPSAAVVEACVQAIGELTCEQLEDDEDPEACASLCE